MKNNITLIGMPSVGKSTVGVVLAKLLGKNFIDTDLILQNSGKRLPQLIAELGNTAFIEYENQTIAELDAKNSVIATGGSAVYGADGMARLKEISTVIYLRATVAELTTRLGDFSQRGVVALGAQSVAELDRERAPLYEKYADIIIDEHGTLMQTVDEIIKILSE